MFERYYRELLNFLSHRVGNRELACDLVQESYARVYAAAGARPVNEPRALLYATARNLVIDHHRRTAVRDMGVTEQAIDLDDAMGPDAMQPEVVLSGRQRLAALEAALQSLPPRPREAFVLYKIDGLSRSEVAQAMGITIRTVESHLEVAMRACMKCAHDLDQDRRGAHES